MRDELPTSNRRPSSISSTSSILGGFGKFPQCERSEPLFPLNFLLDFEELCKKIAVNHKIEEEVIWALGWDFESHFWAEFWFRFWGAFWGAFWTFLGLGFACFTGLFRSRGGFLAPF
jgi:hypothetical protein